MNFKEFINLLKYKDLILFADSKNVYQSKIIDLLRSKGVNFRLLQRKQKKFFFSNFLFYLIFFLNRKSKKIVFVAQPTFAIFYCFLNKFILVSYDCHFGLPKTSVLKLYLEKVVLKKVDYIIHRDLRLWKIYREILFKKKNLLIPDHSTQTSKVFNKDYSNLSAVVLGWIDEKEVQVTETVMKLLNLGVNIEFFITQKCEVEIKKFKAELEKKFPFQIKFNKFVSQEDTVNKISKFHIGICPHSKRKSLISRKYRKYCGSSRVIDYAEAGLFILISRSAHFQRFIARSNNTNMMNIFDLNNFQNKDDLALFIKRNQKNFTISKKIFNNKFLANSLYRFIF